jgi:polyphosphate kinase
MTRNLKHRIEVVVPIVDENAKRFLKDVVLDTYFNDNTKARSLSSDGTYRQIPSSKTPVLNSQTYFMDRAAGSQ